MKKMGTSNILIIGLKGLGIEIGKHANNMVHRLANKYTKRRAGTAVFGGLGKDPSKQRRKAILGCVIVNHCFSVLFCSIFLL